MLPNCLLQGWNLTQSGGKCFLTIWQHSSAQVILEGKIWHPILSVCSNQMQASKTQIFGSLWHLLFFSNAFFKAQMWKKAEEYVPKQVCQHSSAQVIVTGKIRRVLQLYVNFECLFWRPIKCMHSKPRFWVHFGHCFASSMLSLKL